MVDLAQNEPGLIFGWKFSVQIFSFPTGRSIQRLLFPVSKVILVNEVCFPFPTKNGRLKPFQTPNRQGFTRSTRNLVFVIPHCPTYFFAPLTSELFHWQKSKPSKDTKCGRCSQLTQFPPGREKLFHHHRRHHDFGT